MATRRSCDHCGFARQRTDPVTLEITPDVRRYSLRVELDQKRDGGIRTGRYQKSAGGIDLCGECWTKICKPRMNSKKSNRGSWGGPPR